MNAGRLDGTPVDRARDQLLAGSGLPRDEHRGVRSATLATCASTRRRAGDEPTISSNIDARSISSRSARFSLRSAPRRLRSSMSVPSRTSGRSALFVAQGMVSNEEPPILSIVPSGALLVLERFAAPRRRPLLLEPFHVFRVKDAPTEIRAPRFMGGESGVFESEFVDLQSLAVWGEDRDHLRNHLDHGPEFGFDFLTAASALVSAA